MDSPYRSVLRRAASRIARAGSGAATLQGGPTASARNIEAAVGSNPGRQGRAVRDTGFPLPANAPRTLPTASLRAYLDRYPG